MASKTGLVLMIIGGAVGTLIFLGCRYLIPKVLVPLIDEPEFIAHTTTLLTTATMGIFLGLADTTCDIVGISVKKTTSRVMGGIDMSISLFTIIYFLIHTEYNNKLHLFQNIK